MRTCLLAIVFLVFPAATADAQLLGFSLDLGSDNAGDPDSGPTEAKERGFDPGDVYAITSPIDVAPTGTNAELWDDTGWPASTMLMEPDAAPDSMESHWGLSPGASGHSNFFDLDAVQLVPKNILTRSPMRRLKGVVLEEPLEISTLSEERQAEIRRALPYISSRGDSDAVLYLSYDDDGRESYLWKGSARDEPGRGCPQGSYSRLGSVYGGTDRRDEVVKLTLGVSDGVAVEAAVEPFLSEIQVHHNLRPPPSHPIPPSTMTADEHRIAENKHDDDVDALTAYVPVRTRHSALVSVDHEASFGLHPGGIYSRYGSSPVPRVSDDQLGISREADIDAFEFVVTAHPSGSDAIALLYSVDEDDPFTAGNESGGLDPSAIYLSFMTGNSDPFYASNTTLYGVERQLAAAGETSRLFRFVGPSYEPEAVGALEYDDGSPIGRIEAIAADADCTLYMISDGQLSEIDPGHPDAVVPVADVTVAPPSTREIDWVAGMTFDDEGTLWFIDQTLEELYRMPDPRTGVAEHFASLPMQVNSLVYEPSTGGFVATIRATDGHFLRIRLLSVPPHIATTVYKCVGSGCSEVFGLAIDRHGTLLGSDERLWRHLLRESPTTVRHVSLWDMDEWDTRHIHGLTACSPVDRDDIDAIAVEIAGASDPIESSP